MADSQRGHHLALYRSWRPMRFEEVIGQGHVTRTLRNALAGERMAHAYLFCGPRGTGKTSVAKILARAVNCLHSEGGEPCGECGACRSVTEGQSLDVLEIDAASHRGIEEIRELRDKARYSPVALNQKVYIIDEVHMLTTEAFNALLKTLEEPPPHVLFILATTDPHKLPATIVSRCQRFDFHRLSREEIVTRLGEVCRSLSVAGEDGCLDQIAAHADGGLRDALSLLDQCLAFAGGELRLEHLHQLLGTAEREEVAGLAGALVDGDVPAVLATVDRVHERGRELRQVVRDLVGFLRDVLLMKVSAGSGSVIAPPDPLAEGIAERVSVDRLLHLLETLSKLEGDLRWSVQPRLSVEVGLIGAVVGNGGAESGKPAAPAQPTPKPATPAGAAARKETAAAADAGAVSTAEPEEREPVAPVSGDVSLQKIMEMWPTVRERVRKKKPPLYALLEPARPASLRGRNLVLSFLSNYSFHRQRVSEPANKDILEGVLAGIFGPGWSVSCILQGEAPEGKGAPAGETVPAADGGEPVPPSELQDLLEEFGGQVVDIHLNDNEDGEE